MKPLCAPSFYAIIGRYINFFFNSAEDRKKKKISDLFHICFLSIQNNLYLNSSEDRNKESFETVSYYKFQHLSQSSVFWKVEKQNLELICFNSSTYFYVFF